MPFKCDLQRYSKERLGIEDYQLGQTTLEEVFLRFAEEADPAGGGEGEK